MLTSRQCFSFFECVRCNFSGRSLNSEDEVWVSLDPKMWIPVIYYPEHRKFNFVRPNE